MASEIKVIINKPSQKSSAIEITFSLVAESKLRGQNNKTIVKK